MPRLPTVRCRAVARALRSLWRWVLFAVPIVACGERPLSQEDAGVTGTQDAPLPPIADAPCPCTPGDSFNVPVTLSLSCYCARTGGCPDYDTAVSTCYRVAVQTLDAYADCNLEVITTRTQFEAGTRLVYDATTHELVGASVGTDSLGFVCGAGRVSGFQAGLHPPADCAISRTEVRCRDAG